WGGLAERGALEARGQRGGQRIDVAEGQGLVHADIGFAVAILGEALLEQRDEAGVDRRIDVRGHARRVALEPEAVHAALRERAGPHYSAPKSKKGPSATDGPLEGSWGAQAAVFANFSMRSCRGRTASSAAL